MSIPGIFKSWDGKSIDWISVGVFVAGIIFIIGMGLAFVNFNNHNVSYNNECKVIMGDSSAVFFADDYPYGFCIDDLDFVKVFRLNDGNLKLIDNDVYIEGDEE